MEDEPRLTGNEGISRRKFLAFGGAVVLGAMPARVGIRLDAPPLEVKPVPMERENKDVRIILEEDGSENIIRITLNGEVLYDPLGEFFVDGTREYVHRGGNSIESINEAYERGTELFDVDANDVNGVIYGEHGIIPHLDLAGLGLHLPIIVDIDEGELMLGMPNTYEELVAHIAYLSTYGRPLGVSVELKRGPFEPDTLSWMIATHRKYKVPVMVHTPGSHTLEFVDDDTSLLKIAKRDDG